jgi:hypothetical protein
MNVMLKDILIIKRRLKPYVWLMVLIDGYKVVSFLVVKHS